MKGYEPVFLWLAFRMDGSEVTELDSGVRSTGSDAFSLDAHPGDAVAAVTDADATDDDVALPATPWTHTLTFWPRSFLPAIGEGVAECRR